MACGAAGQLLAHHAGRDQGVVVHRGRDVAQGVHRLVGRHKVRGLRAHRQSDPLDLGDQFLAGQLRAHARDRVELVERPAGMTQAVAGQLDHLHPQLGGERRNDERGAVAHAARRMLVHSRAGQAGQVEPLARVDHRVGERDGLFAREAVQVAGHQEGRHLIVGDLLARVGEHEVAQLLRRQLAAVALGGDDVDGSHQLILSRDCRRGNPGRGGSRMMEATAGSTARSAGRAVDRRGP